MNLTESLFKKAKVSVPENVLDRAHRVGPIYTDRVSILTPSQFETWHKVEVSQHISATTVVR